MKQEPTPQVDKRYLVTIDFNVYAKNDQEAQAMADAARAMISRLDDNNARIESIHETPFGSMSSRLVYGNVKSEQ